MDSFSDEKWNKSEEPKEKSALNQSWEYGAFGPEGSVFCFFFFAVNKCTVYQGTAVSVIMMQQDSTEWEKESGRVQSYTKHPNFACA